MHYEYKEVDYDVNRDLLVQINEYCALHHGTKFHSMAQKIANISDFRGQRTPKLIIIFEHLKVIEHDN